MTCIVGMVDGQSVLIGADSAVSIGDQLQTLKQSKVFCIGEMAIGVTGNFRIANVIKWAFDPPKRTLKQSVECYMNTTFVKALRKCLASAGCKKKDSGVETAEIGFLVGYNGQLFNVSGDFCVIEYAARYMATGSGQDYALGALYALDDRAPHSAREKIKLALKAAAEFCCSVRGPFKIIEVKSCEKTKQKVLTPARAKTASKAKA